MEYIRMETKTTTINIDRDLADAIKRLGKMGETYNDVLWTLVQEELKRKKK